jgi:hypothetical protein
MDRGNSLYGIFVLQTYIYAFRFKGDPLVVRLFVGHASTYYVQYVLNIFAGLMDFVRLSRCREYLNRAKAHMNLPVFWTLFIRHYSFISYGSFWSISILHWHWYKSVGLIKLPLWLRYAIHCVLYRDLTLISLP